MSPPEASSNGDSGGGVANKEEEAAVAGNNGGQQEQENRQQQLSSTKQSQQPQPPHQDTSDSHPAVESLGEALAGVNLGGGGGDQTSSNNGTSFMGGSSDPFSLAPGAAANALAANNNDGWGNHFTTAPGPATSALDNNNENNALDNAHVRNESLELFLSQSPSQTLGEEVFKFSHTNLPALAEEEHRPKANNADEAFRMPNGTTTTTSGAIGNTNKGELRPQDASTRRRTESPSVSVTGTTTSSRSVSPYGNSSDISGNRNSIPAYGGKYDAGTTSTASESLSRGQGSNPSLSTLDNRSPYGTNKDRNQIKNTGYESAAAAQGAGLAAPFVPQAQQQQPLQPQMLDPTQPLQMPAVAGGAGTPAGQVLYMAVPSPDGRGQVLQPVQMMQLPGKPYTYVVPGTLPGGLQSPDQPMMVLPPMQTATSPGAAASGAADYSRASSYSIDTADNRLYGDRGDDYAANSGSSAGLFQTDPAIASLYAAPQRPPLDALLGQVRRLSRDQVGCRLVQQALDEEGPMAATLILQEGLSFWGEAMVDPFGNYLFQKILEKVTPEERTMLVKNVQTRLVNASLNLHGTRSVQKIVEVCAQDEEDGHTEGVEVTAATILTKALAPAAARLCIDSHGNHVIQRILLRLGPKHAQFIFDAVAASVGDVARHRHGCCVIQRCLDSPQSDARANLVRRIVEKALELMQDAYGNYVVQYVLDVCSDDDVHAVCESVAGKVNLLAIQKFSSNVMEKCLERCTDRVKESYLAEISDSERIRELMMDPFGNYVVQRALSVATHSQAIRLVEAMRPHLIATQTAGPNGQRNGGVRNTAGGRRIIAKICRRFPNFTLNPVGTQDELYSQNKGNHRYLNHHQQSGHHMHKQPPLLASYAQLGAQNPMQPQFVPDPRLAQMQQQQPQQPHYGLGGANAPAYYDPFTDGHGGYLPPGM